ncbi:MAG TPA: hypothetical protein VIJ12_09985 [Candidatus Baltobacteraceae bacterium]
MDVVSEAIPASGLRSLSGSLDIETSAEDAFALLCAVEKWPVWLSLLRSARRVDRKSPLTLGSEVVLRSSIPGEEEQCFEVDQLVSNFRVSLVGAYSLRRRIEFRIERKSTRSRIHARISYPAYHGRLGAWFDGMRHARRLAAALNHSLALLRGMLEQQASPDALPIEA